MTSTEHTEITMSQFIERIKKVITDADFIAGETGAKAFAHEEIGFDAFVAAKLPITTATESQWRNSVYMRCVRAFPFLPVFVSVCLLRLPHAAT